ncbi:MAG: nucleoside kinase, partial [Oscillospiraceae bacterium]|nr:nucleoside kinase [Oscillospiraceae bacterium]
SGSGKTTSAMKIAEQLEKRGVRTHYVAMDDYFNTVDPATTPRTPEGELDLESPLCLDMDLLNEHFTLLSEGKRVFVPKYEFSRRMRIQEPSKSIKLREDEMVIFEGIHALNDMITSRHPEAFKLYISARSDVEFEGKIVFKRTWFRLVRRMVRDYNFRGSDPAETMAMWANVRRGELNNISPFKDKANFQFDTALPYELPVFNHTATQLFQAVPEGIERYEELRGVLPALQLFGDIDEALVASDSLIREFIGGGIYEY